MKLGIVVLVALAGVARAQIPTINDKPDVSVELLTPAPGPGAVWQVESADVAAAGAPTLTFTSWLATRPLVVSDVVTGRTDSVPVADRVGVDVGIAYGILGRGQLTLSLPFVAAQTGDRLQGLDLPGTDAARPLAAATFGDLRLGAKWQLVAPPRGHGFGAALDAIVTLPTGDQDQFAGDPGVIVEARAIASYRRPRFSVALNVGPRLRSDPVELLAPHVTLGQALAWGAAGTFSIDRRWTALVEAAGDWGGSGGQSPAEARAGLRWRIDRAWTIGGGVGFGIASSAAIGSPGFRAMLDLHFEPKPRADVDGDGVPDVVDRCPTQPEDRDGFEDADGCPDPDNDQDGVPDVRDACPNQPEDLDGFKDADGCPDPDDDGDGIPDKLDKCPFEPEDMDGFQDADGCPDRDNDSDGIPDVKDRCPDEPEDYDGFQDADGCPDPDNDHDGVPDADDKCPTAAEDRDGFEDADGCPDPDNDRDGVPDELDKCPDEPETITSPTDTEQDGCPDGEPMATALPDGTMRYTPIGRAALDREDQVAILAVARAAHHVGWDEATSADGQIADALIVVVGPADEARGERVAAALRKDGVRAHVEARADAKGLTILATREALIVGPEIKVQHK